MASHVLNSGRRYPIRGHRALAIVTLVAIGVSSCGDDGYGNTGAGANNDIVVVSDAWARSSPAGVADGVAYMTIESPVDDQLVAVSVPADVATTVEMHETVVGDATGATGTGAHDMTDDTAATMTMRQVSAVELPAGEAVVFGPGGLHVMLLGLATPLASGSSFELTLTFATAAPETVTVDVRDEAP